MYEGYLQHDAQEVLQCILGYIQEACDTIRKELKVEGKEEDVSEVKLENGLDLGSGGSGAESKASTEEDGQVAGKRKSDTEVGNAKKKSKSLKSKKSDSAEENLSRNRPLTRSKRKSSSEITMDSSKNKGGEEAAGEEETKKPNGEGGSDDEGKGEKTCKEADGKRKKRAKLSCLRPSGKQPSIFSKFRSVGKISCTTVKNQNKTEQENGVTHDESEKNLQEPPSQNASEHSKAPKHQGTCDLRSS